MSAPPRNDQPGTEGLSRREELNVSGAAMSSAPWGAAAVTGGVVTLADLGLHLISLSGISLSGLTGSISFGAIAFFAVAAAGALWRARGRAARWARSNPWRFAVLPGAACAALVFVLSVMLGNSGFLGGVFAALWHGGAAYGLTGLAGSVGGTRRRSA
jgi:hypothetical protein